MPIELNRVQNKNITQGALTATTSPVQGAPEPEVRTPELPKNINWNELITKLSQMGIDTTSGIFGAASSLAQNPDNIALIANGQSIPGISNKDIAALGAIARGFESSRPQPLDPLTQANIEKLKAETEKLKTPQEKENGDITNDFIKFKKDFDDVTKNYRLAQEGWNKVASAAKSPSAAGDVAMIFGFMKTIDPGSTVREGEFATIQNARGVPEAVISVYNQVLSGERLSDRQREDYANKAYSAFQTYTSQYNNIKKQYTAILEKFKVDPLALTPYENAAAPELTFEELNRARKTAQPEIDLQIKKLEDAIAKSKNLDFIAKAKNEISRLKGQ